MHPYIFVKLDWAKAAIESEDTSLFEQWQTYNPEFVYCKEHHWLSRSNAFVKTRDCGVCSDPPMQCRVDNLTIENARLRWQNEHDKLQILHQHETDMKPELFKRLVNELNQLEWDSWINYEMRAEEFGNTLHSEPVTPQQYAVIGKKIQDNMLRNQINTNRVYCFQHKQMGDEFPWQRYRAGYNPKCMKCFTERHQAKVD